MKYFLLLASLTLAANVGCSQADSSAPQQPKSPQASASSHGFAGKVLETMNAGEYTYVLVDTGTNKCWAAAPKFAVQVGDTAAIAASMPMPNYHSKTLDRDFDVVYFAERVAINGAQPPSSGTMSQLPKDHPPIGGSRGSMPDLPKDHPPIAAASKPNLDLSGVTKADGGKTVAEIYAEKTELGGKVVKVRGKVVKFNAMIMGKNWLHLRDGSGAEGSNDLLVTSASQAKVGDTVVASGVLSLNKDFGANYKYPVMIEDAKITAE